MIKYLGLFFIFISSILIGISLTERMNNKIKILKSVKLLLQHFKIKITYQMPTVAELFSENNDTDILQLTDKISENLKKGLSPDESIQNGFKCSPCVSVLSDAEKYLIINTFSSLGTSDTDGQISLLENSLNSSIFT